MHPPSAVCRALYRLHPQLRLAWQGRSRGGDELNAGNFAVVQLFHLKDCGGLADATTYQEFWNVTTEMEGGTPRRVRANRGPIFNRFGGTSLDYDPAFRFPIFMMTLDDQYEYPWGDPVDGVTDVMSGKFLIAMEHWLSPIKKRLADSYDEYVADTHYRAEELGREMTDHLWHAANKTGETSDHTVAYKHVRHHIVDNDDRIHNNPLDEMFSRGHAK